MKLYKISLALLMGVGILTSCSDKLDVTDPNQPTTTGFGSTAAELEESVIAMYNHIRMEGSYARVGYGNDICRADEVWNCSQQWYLPIDDLIFSVEAPVADGNLPMWVWREWYYTINVCNFILSKCDEVDGNLDDQMKKIKGQALFMRGLAYYNLSGYFQNPILVTDYSTYASLDGLYAPNKEEGDEDVYAQYDRVLDQVEKDFSEAMSLLPSRDEGGEWAKGRATNGAAAGYYARTLMQRHKYSEALTVLKAIINGTYGHYKLMADYGDNFQEGKYENNAESLFEVQFLDYGSQGADDEWTPVNTSKNATQGHAIETNLAPGDCNGWSDLAAAPWLYELFKAERTTDGSLDPRLYWTIGTYEPEWEGYAYGNVCYTNQMTADTKTQFVTNNNYGGLPIAKHTNLRTGLYSSVVQGLHCGVNLRLMRYSDVLLRAAECENEVNGPTQQAIDWINQVRTRAKLKNLTLAEFDSKDKLFEQIANVERPKELGCEFGRGFDLIRWGFFYTPGRLQQLKEHGTFRKSNDKSKLKDPVSYADISTDAELKSSFDTYKPGHEYLPIVTYITNVNPNVTGNSANENKDNAAYFSKKGWTVHPVVSLGGK